MCHRGQIKLFHVNETMVDIAYLNVYTSGKIQRIYITIF